MKIKPLFPAPMLMLLVAALACNETTSPTVSPLRADVATTTPSYTITDLGTLGGASGTARAINNAGQIVGTSATTSGDSHAFLWTAAGGMTDLGTLGGTASTAWAINNRGHIVGVSTLASGQSHPFYWTPAGGMQDLGSFGGDFGIAFSINDLDQVVGRSDLPDGSIRAFLWTARGGLVDLSRVVGDNSEALDINNRQQIVGGSNFSTPPNDFCAFTNPFLSSVRGGYQNLGELGTPDVDPCGGAFARSVNENGVVVGFAENNDFFPRAFRWTAQTGLVDLGALTDPDGFAQASAVNDGGQIVGISTAVLDLPNAGGLTQHATLWDSNGIHDLGALPDDFLSQAFGINASGQIVGLSRSFSFNNRAVLWTPQQ